jgi:DNA-binding MarR family transcriptional regulator
MLVCCIQLDEARKQLYPATTIPPSPPEDLVTVGPDSVAALGDQVIRLQRAFAGMRQQLVASGSTSGDGVEWAAYGLLFQLVNDGPRRSSALAEIACVDPSTVSRQVAQLVKAGLVERQSDPEDGRASLLVATVRGREAYAAKQEHRQRMFAHVLDDWAADDVDALTALLARFNDSFVEHRQTVPDLQHHDRLPQQTRESV